MKVVVTGAAGQIAYSLVPFLCEEGVFSSSQKIDLKLVEIPQAMERLNGFVKELEDSAYSTVNSISTFDNIHDATIDADWCLLVGSKELNHWKLVSIFGAFEVIKYKNIKCKNPDYKKKKKNWKKIDDRYWQARNLA